MELSANLLPRNRSNTAGSIFGYSALDFFSPRFFDAGIAALIQTFDEQARQLSTIFRRELRGHLVEFVDDFRHMAILRNLAKKLT
jgi:hypothetical protein